MLVYTVNSSNELYSSIAEMHPARKDSDPALVARCGALYAAPYDLSPGGVSRYTDPATGITVELIDEMGAFRVRISRP